MANLEPKLRPISSHGTKYFYLTIIVHKDFMCGQLIENIFILRVGRWGDFNQFAAHKIFMYYNERVKTFGTKYEIDPTFPNSKKKKKKKILNNSVKKKNT